jgi:omega-6 fatty acid desaturase (delta-12 desaturase)
MELRSELNRVLQPYRTPRWLPSTVQMLSTLLPLVLLFASMVYTVPRAYWATLALSVPTSLLAVRLFVLFHDCAHGSFFPSRRVNEAVGFLLGIFLLTPFHAWRWDHVMHHATSADLDRRGHGDIRTLTVDEYLRLSLLRKWAYRLYRHPITLFVLGPLLQFVVIQRFAHKIPPSYWRGRASVYLTNFFLAAGVIAIWYAGALRQFLQLILPVVTLGPAIGVWLFYVQHQFEDTYWQAHDQWDFAQAGLRGSSYYRLPKVLQWFTANIGLHHIHHVDCRIPNYRLQTCYDENPGFRAVTPLTLWRSLSCARLKLWDERNQRLVTFADATARSNKS